MNGRTLLAMLITTLFVAMMAVAAPSRAAAQGPGCCTYTVIVSGVYPPSCTQFKVLTRWGGAAAPMGSVGITGTGPSVFAVPYVCPPVLPFTWVSFDGGITTYGLGYSGPVTINGCPRTLTVQLGTGGCIEILIS